MYTKEQQTIVQHAAEKVRAYFKKYPVRAHGFDHAERVRDWAIQIAHSEKADVFLAELAALLHDVGRVQEKFHPEVRHHELSYDLCRDWFKNDEVLSRLSKREKVILLYAIRNHWNNMANKYPEAIILRDADKIDALGTHGLKRSLEFFDTEDEVLNDLRYRGDYLFWFKTKYVQRIVKKQKLFEPILRYYKKLLTKHVKAVSL